ncbi:hypothetical protein U0070_016142, partial [Myodes glareolus]
MAGEGTAAGGVADTDTVSRVKAAFFHDDLALVRSRYVWSWLRSFMVSTTSIQDGGSQKLGDQEGSATLLKWGKAAKWLVVIAQRFRNWATRL